MNMTRADLDREDGLEQLLSSSEWSYRNSNLTLTHRTNGYQIDLEQITDKASLLDWIAQVGSKRWSRDRVETAKTLGEFVFILMNIFGPDMWRRGALDMRLDVKSAIKDRTVLQRDYA